MTFLKKVMIFASPVERVPKYRGERGQAREREGRKVKEGKRGRGKEGERRGNKGGRSGEGSERGMGKRAGEGGR